MRVHHTNRWTVQYNLILYTSYTFHVFMPSMPDPNEVTEKIMPCRPYLPPTKIPNPCRHHTYHILHSTLPITKKKYVEILLHYRWLFIRGDVIICEWGIFSVDIFLHYSWFFIKGNFIIGRVQCTLHTLSIPIYLHKNIKNMNFTIFYVHIRWKGGSVIIKILRGPFIMTAICSACGVL